MDKLQLLDKTNNVKYMNLSEIKNLLYLNKNTNKLNDKVLNMLKNKIKDLIEESNKITDTSEYIDNSEESINMTESTNSNESTESNESNESNYLDDVKKLYSRNDKKAENERFTQSSRKLYDRMMSQAEIINKSYKNISKKEIDRPFVNDNINDNIKKLGERKNIKMRK